MLTAITNTSGVTRHFGWIPPHGRTLTDGTQVVITGDIRSILGSGFNRYTRKIETTSMDSDVANARCTICTWEVDPCASSGSSYTP